MIVTDTLTCSKQFLLTSTYPKSGNTIIWERAELKYNDKIHYISLFKESRRLGQKVVLHEETFKGDRYSCEDIQNFGWVSQTKRGDIYRVREYDTFEELIVDNLDMFL